MPAGGHAGLTRAVWIVGKAWVGETETSPLRDELQGIASIGDKMSTRSIEGSLSNEPVSLRRQSNE